MVFQDGALYPHLTVAENIGFPARMEPPGAKPAAQRVTEAAALTGVSELLRRRPDQLSGGERQRVALARALIREPVALLLDEPLSNVDAAARGELRVAIATLTRRLRLGTLCVTHDQAGALGMADRVAVMRSGRVAQVGTPGEIYSNPNRLFVAAFIGSPRTSLLQGAIYAERGVASLLDLGDQALRVPWEQPKALVMADLHNSRVVVGLRPDALRVVPPETPGALRGRVAQVDSLGPELLVWLDIGGIPPALGTSELDFPEPVAAQVTASHAVGDGLRHALSRLVPRAPQAAPAPTQRTPYGFYPVYEPDDLARSGPAGMVALRLAPTQRPAIDTVLSVAVDLDRLFLFDGTGARLRLPR